MATLYKHIPYERIARIAPIMALNGEGIATTQTRAGCDYIINAGTYNFDTRELDSGLKIDGEYLARRENHGLGINKDGRLEWSYAGVWVQTWFGMFGVSYGNGSLQGKHITTKAQRTGLGCDENGIILAATTDLITTKTFAQRYFGSADAWINLDGGGSTQWISPEGKYISGREVVWYIGIWLTDSAKKEETMASWVTNLPINGKFEITAAFGDVNPSLWTDGHKGIDFAAANMNIYSPCDGEVRVVSYDSKGWGYYVSIGDEAGYRHILCHLKKGSIKVKKGQKVTRTTIIGTMGDTGNAKGIHLHYQINRPDGTAVDPSFWTHIPNKRGIYEATDFKINAATGELLTPVDPPAATPTPEPSAPAHWAQQHYDALVARGVIDGGDTSSVWLDFDASAETLNVAHILALVDKATK